MTTHAFPTDFDAAERFVLAAADGHHAACIRIAYNATMTEPMGALSMIFALAVLVVRLARVSGGDAWHGVLRSTLTELRQQSGPATGD